MDRSKLRTAPVDMPSRVVGRRVAEVRRRLEPRVTQQDLADRVTAFGSPMHQTTVARIEKGQRPVSLGEALQLAAALGVSPLALFVPSDPAAELAIAPKLVVSALRVRQWFKGLLPLGTDEFPVKPDTYFDELGDEWAAARRDSDGRYSTLPAAIGGILATVGGIEREAARMNGVTFPDEIPVDPQRALRTRLDELGELVETALFVLRKVEPLTEEDLKAARSMED